MISFVTLLAILGLLSISWADQTVRSVAGDQRVTDPVIVGDNSILDYYGGSNYDFSNNFEIGRGTLYIGKESYFSSFQSAPTDVPNSFHLLIKNTNNLQNNGQFIIENIKRHANQCSNSSIQVFPINFQNDGEFEIISGGVEGRCCLPTSVIAPQNFLNNGKFYYKVLTDTGSIYSGSCMQNVDIGASTTTTVNNNLWEFTGSINAQINGAVSGAAQINLDGSNMFVNANTFSGQVVNLINGGSFLQTSDPLSNIVVINGLGTSDTGVTSIAVKGKGKSFTYNPSSGIVKLTTVEGKTYAYQIGCDSPGHTITGTTTTTLYGPHTHSSVSTPSSSSESSTTSNSSIESSSLPHTSVSSTPESSITPSSNTISSNSPGHTITGTTTTTLYGPHTHSSVSTPSSSSESSTTSNSSIESSSLPHTSVSSTPESSITPSSNTISSNSPGHTITGTTTTTLYGPHTHSSVSTPSSSSESSTTSNSSIESSSLPHTSVSSTPESSITPSSNTISSNSPGHTITGTTTTTLYESSIYSSSSSTIQESELSNTSRTTMTSNSSVSISSTSSRSSFSNTKSSTIVISQSASLPDSKTDIILSTSSNIGYSSRSLLSDLGTSISDSDIHHSVLHSTESYSSNESGTNPFTSIASLSNFIPESSSHTSTALGSENSVISSDILTTMSHPVATNSGDKPTTPKRSEQVSTTMTSSGPTPDTSSFDTDGMSAYSRPEFTTNSLEVNKSSTSQLGNNKQTFSNLQLESTRPHSENEVDNNTRLLQSIQQSSTYGTNNVNPLSPTGSISIPLTEDGQGDNNNWNSPATNDLCTQISFNLTATTITVTDRITITDSIHDISSEVITSYIYQTIVDQKTVTQTVDGKSLANKMSSIPKPSSRSLIQPQPPVAIELQEGAASTSRVSLVSLFISIILVLL
ncbi:hypothetical protein AO441_003193 [Nakaseomyces glabratus]|nr:hypothetical protein AO441_003193 [Nakaseomyces glabratus]KTB19643.1 hypothetical protein AO438_003347 [Nakaseomyces glabratus]